MGPPVVPPRIWVSACDLGTQQTLPASAWLVAHRSRLGPANGPSAPLSRFLYVVLSVPSDAGSIHLGLQASSRRRTTSRGGWMASKLARRAPIPRIRTAPFPFLSGFGYS